MALHTPRNFYSSTLAADHVIGDGQLTVVDGSPYASASPSNPGLVVVKRTSDSSYVVFEVTGEAANVLTISGAVDGTSDIALSTGDVIQDCPVKLYLSELQSRGTRSDPWDGFTGENILVTPVLASDVPLTVQLAASQSADAMQVLDSSSNVLANITHDGHASLVGLTLPYDPGQVGNDLRWLDSTGSMLAAIRSVGGSALELIPGANFTSYRIFPNGPNGVSTVTYSAWECGIHTDSPGATWDVHSVSAGVVCLRTCLAASQTADAFQVVDSSNNVLTKLNNDGGLSISPSSASTAPITLTCNNSQTADILHVGLADGNQIAKLFYTGGSAAMRVGYLNGTLDGAYVQMDAYGANPTVSINRADTVGSNLVLYTTADSETWRIGVDFSDTTETLMFKSHIGGYQVLSLLQGGNVLVNAATAGTSSAQLEVHTKNASTVGQTIYLSASQTADAFQVLGSTSNLLTVIDASGHVGIGTTSPNALLDVQTTAAHGYGMIRMADGNNDWRVGITAFAHFGIFNGTSTTQVFDVSPLGQVSIANDGSVSSTSMLWVRVKDAATVGQTIKAAATLAATISNVALTSNVATITTSANHGFLTNETVVITGLTNTEFNGTYKIASVPTSTTFTYALTHADVTSVADSGTATVDQTADLFQVLDGAGSVLARIDSTGSSHSVYDYASRFYMTGTHTWGLYDGDTDGGLVFYDATASRIGAKLTSGGSMVVGNSATASAQLHVAVGSSSTIGQIIKLTATPTADAFQVLDSNSTSLATINKTGGGYFAAFTKIGSGTGSGDSNSGLDVATGANSAIHSLGSTLPAVYASNTTGAVTKIQSSTSAGLVGTQSNHPLGLYTNNLQRVTIDTSGNVGIGTTPDYPLTFANTLGSKINLYQGQNWGIGLQSSEIQIIAENSTGVLKFGHGTSAALNTVFSVDGGGKITSAAPNKSVGLDLTSGGYLYCGVANDGPPSATDMTGAKIVFFGGTGTSSTSYAIGEESNYMWFNAPGSGFKFYNGTSVKATIDTSGNIQAAGGISTALNTVTADYTIASYNSVLLADASAGAITLTLPAANSVPNGRQFVIKAKDVTNTITIAASGTDKIDGAASMTLATQYQSVTLVGDGSANWYII